MTSRSQVCLNGLEAGKKSGISEIGWKRITTVRYVRSQWSKNRNQDSRLNSRCKIRNVKMQAMRLQLEDCRSVSGIKKETSNDNTDWQCRLSRWGGPRRLMADGRCPMADSWCLMVAGQLSNLIEACDYLLTISICRRSGQGMLPCSLGQ